MKRFWIFALLVLVVGLGAAGCGTSTDAEVASENLSTAAEQFEVDRRVVVYNGITDRVKLEVEGPCNIEDERIQLEITCAISGVGTGHPQAIKNFAGLSDNVTYYVEQLHPIGVSTTQYRVIFKPEAIIPNFDRP
jgi:hypothetical protein